MLDSVAKRGTRYPRIITLQKVNHSRSRMVPCFPQHPANRFVDEVVLIGEQLRCNRKRIRKIASIDERGSRYHRDPTLPAFRRFGETIKNATRSAHQVLSYDI